MPVDYFPPEEQGGPAGSKPRPKSREALDHLFSVTYEELRRLASAVRRRDPAATLSPTTLVNEAWLKLAKTPAVAQSSHLHFKRIAARAMRQVLIAAVRRRTAYKRDAGPGMVVVFDDAMGPVTSCDEELIALDAALDELARMNPRHAAMVESRFFGGLEVNEIAALLGVSEATILRDWRAARAWLARQLGSASTERTDGR
ncbi:MAG: sigma-70 family RNA polymerase sigma factor [Bryobacteraceae bacterium]|nr:sigma-70 family RNA polymerase sigma factor [Bryobacterales bacterium]MEB2362013.1 ECF-type sigma factor [Bryobacterales bacterium]NUN01985.1 sigma-70 family RNA polymerase sigma factor [Bryobacteraceae bacterium]